MQSGARLNLQRVLQIEVSPDLMSRSFAVRPVDGVLEVDFTRAWYSFQPGKNQYLHCIIPPP